MCGLVSLYFYSHSQLLLLYVDIDECAGNNNCSPNAVCTNTPGNFICACNQGYSGNGITCTGKYNNMECHELVSFSRRY